MSKNELLEMISNLEVQLNEAEDKITMSTHLQVNNNLQSPFLRCKSYSTIYGTTVNAALEIILGREQRFEIIDSSLQRMEQQIEF